MLDFSGIHIVIVLIVALLVVGPKDLPKFLRMIGKAVGKMRRMADQFRTSFDDMARQSELDELREELDKLRNQHSPQRNDSAEQPHADFDHDQHAGLRPQAPILPEGVTPAEPLKPASESKQ